MIKHFIFHASYFECVQRFPIETQKNIIYNLVSYAMTGNKPIEMTPEEELAFVLIKPTIDKSLALASNGAKGGSSGGGESKTEANTKQTLSKTQANLKQTQSKTQANAKQTPSKDEICLQFANDLLYQDNNQDIIQEKEMEKDNILYVNNKNKNLLESARACAREEILEKFIKHHEELLACHPESSEWGSKTREVINIMTDFAFKAQTEPIKFGEKEYAESDVEALFFAVDTERFTKIVGKCKFKEDIQDLPWYVFGCFLNQALLAQKEEGKRSNAKA